MTFWDISTLKSPCSWVAPPVVPNRNSIRRARVCDDCCGRLELLERFEKSHEIASFLLRQVQREPRVVEVHDLFERRCLDVPLTEATTSSLEALRAYSQGLKTWNTKGEVEAPPYLKRALELDPQFASAYEKTIEVQRNVTSLNGTSGQLWLSRLGVAYRFALRRPFVDALRTGLLRANFAWLRNRAGGRPNSRLKARLKAGSDS